MVRLYVNVQFQVKPLSTGTSLSQNKKKFPQNTWIDPPKVRTKFQVSVTSIYWYMLKSNFKSNQ